jgi:formamidopyrimidine-DNA glycosylase
MPELPEVQTVVDTIAPHLAGRRVDALRHLRPDIVGPAGLDLAALITGRTVRTVRRRAKRIVVELDDGCFYVHLGMTGRLSVCNADAPVALHTHLILDLDDGRQLRFVDPRRFGGVFWMGATPHHDNVGPEPLTLTPARLGKQLSATRRAVKVALLDQQLIAGIGNIYADEALHAAGIHPLTPGRDLSPEQIRTLNRAIKTTLRRAIRAGGSSIRDYVDANGASGSFQNRHAVYDRAGDPCRRCRTPIERIILGGRSTHFCPKCQPPHHPS